MRYLRATVACGDCFKWALDRIKLLYEEDPDTSARLVHALVFNPEAQPGERSWYDHAWVENPDTNVVWDWQNMVALKKGGVPLDQFYSVHQPKQLTSYTAPEAVALALTQRHYGPWS